MYSTDSKKPESESRAIKIFINLTNLTCDTFYSVIIFVCSGDSDLLVALGILTVFMRCCEKVSRMYYYFRTEKTSYIDTTLPKSNHGIVLFCAILCCNLYSLYSYVKSKLTSFSAISSDLGDNGFTDFLNWFLPIWQVLSLTVALYVAFWFVIGKVRKHTEKNITKKDFLVNRFGRELTGLNDCDYCEIVNCKIIDLKKNQKPSQQKATITSDKKIFIEQIIAGTDFTIEDSQELKDFIVLKEKETEKLYLLKSINESRIEIIPLTQENNRKLIDFKEVEYKKINGWHWKVHKAIKCKKNKIPIAIIDYLADLPFAYFAVCSDLPTEITTFLCLCIPLGLVESLVYNIHYFKKNDLLAREEELNSLNNNKIKNILSKFLLLSALISAFSRLLIRLLPTYQVCYSILEDKLFAAIIAFVAGFTYMQRNVVNALDARKSTDLWVKSLHRGYSNGSTKIRGKELKP